LRITGGSARGQVIKTLPGLQVRPTTDKVREAIFSMLAHIAPNWQRGLDLFAGSGALVIEALSRESNWIDFVDQNNKCCQIIKQNLKKTGFAEKAHVYCCPVSKALGFLDNKYDVIFLDPPYADTTLDAIIRTLSESHLITANSVVTVSHSSRSNLADDYEGLNKIREKRYGDTCISIYQKEGLS